MLRRLGGVLLASALAFALSLGPNAIPIVLAAAEAVDDDYGRHDPLVLEDRPFAVDAPGVLANDVATGRRGACVARPPTRSAAGGSVRMGADGAFVYLPPPDFFGRDSIPYGIAARTSGALCPEVAESSAFVRLEVTPVNDPPRIALGAACPPLIRVPEDDGAWAATALCAYLSTAGPSNEGGQVKDRWVVEVGNPGLFSRQPELPEHHAGYLMFTPAENASGTSTILIRAVDSGGTDHGGVDTSEPRVVTIQVEPVNDLPVANADAYAARRGEPLEVAAPGVLRNDSDVDGTTLTAVLESNPIHGTVELAADGSFRYVPEAGFTGLDAFSYRASDGELSSSRLLVTLDVGAGTFATGTPASAGPPASGARRIGDAVALVLLALVAAAIMGARLLLPRIVQRSRDTS